MDDRTDEIISHQKDYKEDIWLEYELNELGNFVHLLAKRAAHREADKPEKRHKDLYDAKNYLWFMEQKLKRIAKQLGVNFEEL
jgi:hypothetical protein